MRREEEKIRKLPAQAAEPTAPVISNNGGVSDDAEEVRKREFDETLERVFTKYNRALRELAK